MLDSAYKVSPFLNVVTLCLVPVRPDLLHFAPLGSSDFLPQQESAVSIGPDPMCNGESPQDKSVFSPMPRTNRRYNPFKKQHEPHQTGGLPPVFFATNT